MPTKSADDQLMKELEQLLSQPQEKIRQWESSIYDKLAGSLSNSLVLYGAGGLGRKTLRGLRNLGIEPLAFTDNNPNLHGRLVDGLMVFSVPEAAKKFGAKALFLVTVYTDSAPGSIELIMQKLSELGCKKVVPFGPFFWKHPEQFLPHYVCDLPHKVIEAADSILETWALLEDDISRKEYFAQIHWRLKLEYDQIPAKSEHEIYFPPDLIMLIENEVFVDCGAYNGDTVRSFIQQSNGRFGKLLAFEPDPVNYKKLVELATSLPEDINRRIKTSDLALGSRSERLYFDALGVASSSLSTSGSIQIQSEPLDQVIACESPTYIKMDIEGAEMDALTGASQLIKKHLPILAISVYHHQDHIWSIPLMIHSLSKEYKFYLRRYTPHVLDDLVLYAIPKNREPTCQPQN